MTLWFRGFDMCLFGCFCGCVCSGGCASGTLPYSQPELKARSPDKAYRPEVRKNSPNPAWKPVVCCPVWRLREGVRRNWFSIGLRMIEPLRTAPVASSCLSSASAKDHRCLGCGAVDASHQDRTNQSCPRSQSRAGRITYTGLNYLNR